MEEQLIEDKVNLFLHEIIIIQKFIKDNLWGSEILKKVVKGEIPRSKVNIKNSPIKSYFFHGTGCDFRFKSYSIDISLIDDIVSFNTWSLLMYFKNEINEELITKYIKELVEEEILVEKEGYFSLHL